MKGNNNNSKNENESDDSNEDNKKICKWCRKTRCKWYDYVAEIRKMDSELERLDFGDMTTDEIRYEQTSRRFTCYRICDRICAHSLAMTYPLFDPEYRIRTPLPQCVEDKIKGMYPDPEGNYTGFIPSKLYDKFYFG